MSLTEPFDEAEPEVTDRKAIRKKAKKADLEQERRLGALAEVMKNGQCREFFMWLIKKCHLAESSACVNSHGFDPYGTFFNEGARSVGIVLQGEMTLASPKLYALMLQEEQERQELRKNGNDGNG